MGQLTWNETTWKNTAFYNFWTPTHLDLFGLVKTNATYLSVFVFKSFLFLCYYFFVLLSTVSTWIFQCCKLVKYGYALRKKGGSKDDEAVDINSVKKWENELEKKIVKKASDENTTVTTRTYTWYYR